MMNAYSRRRAALFAAHAAGSYEAGLAIARAAHEEYPQEHARTYYWQACMLSLLGRDAEARDVLARGLDEGVWYDPHMLETDPDLSALRGAAAFAAIRGECATRQAERQATARAECLVVGPATAVWEPRWILALHPRGQTARGFAEHWMPLVDEGWALVVPQSSQVCDSSSFAWDDKELALREIRIHIGECVGKRGMDPNGLVMAGASQGARLALESAHEAGVPWLCVIPAFPRDYDVSPLLGVPSHVRGVFLLGEEDPVNAHTRRIAEALASAGAPVTTRVMPGAGHELPEDFPRHARESLESLSEPGLPER